MIIITNDNNNNNNNKKKNLLVRYSTNFQKTRQKSITQINLETKNKNNNKTKIKIRSYWSEYEHKPKFPVDIAQGELL